MAFSKVTQNRVVRKNRNAMIARSLLKTLLQAKPVSDFSEWGRRFRLPWRVLREFFNKLLIFRGDFLGGFHDQCFNWSFAGFQFEAQLILEVDKNRRTLLHS